jgi:hypothetical protein
MKNVTLSLLILFIPAVISAQISAGNNRATFHIVGTYDKNNGIGFSYGCSDPDGILKEIFVCKNGVAYLYRDTKYGTDGSKPDSVSITSDTDIISYLQKTITPDFIKASLRDCPECPDTFCGYFIYITVNGKTNDFAALDAETIKRYPDELKRLKPLINMLDMESKRYITK